MSEKTSNSLRATAWNIRKTAVIFPAAFMMAFAQSMHGLGVIFLMKDRFDATGSDVGGFFALNWAVYLVGCIFLRPLTDRMLPRTICAISLFALTLITTALLFCTRMEQVYLSGAFTGLAISMFWPPLMGWMAVGLEGERLNRTTGRYNLAWSGGVLVSMPIAGFLTEANVALPLWVAIGFWLMAGLMVTGAALVLPRIRADRATPRQLKQAPDSEEHTTRLRYAAWVGLFSACCAIGAINAIFPLAAKNDLHMREGLIGILRFVSQVCTTLGFALLGRILFWHYRGFAMLVGQMLFVVALVLLVLAQSPATIGLVFVCVGSLYSLSYVYSIFHGSAGSTDRAGRMAIHEAILSAGFLVGSLLGGVIYDLFGIGVFYLTFGGIIVLFLPIQIAITAWTRKEEGNGIAGDAEL
jgi:MFS family permease